MKRAKQPVRILLLGGTGEANALARRIAGDGRFAPTLSLAGRTSNPVTPDLPLRIGGFGGVQGLRDYIVEHQIGVVIDATHPFAAVISANAIAACKLAAVPLIALERPPWQPETGDLWHSFATVEEAIDALPKMPRRIFSGLGRLSLDALARAPQHHYIIRVIDRIAKPDALPHATIVAARGPFRADDDLLLFATLGIDIVLAKNSGGDAAYSKIAAARRRGIPVMMIARPHSPPRTMFATVDEVWADIEHHHAPPTERGV